MPEKVQKALEFSGALEQAHRKAPSLDDLKAELGSAVQASVDADGKVSGTIQGHDAVMRAWQMQQDYHLAKSDIAEGIQSGVRRIPMLDRDGRVRLVREEAEDRSAAKHRARKLRSRSNWTRYILRDGEPVVIRQGHA